MDDLKGILVIGEVDDKKLTSITRELLGGARSLSGSLGDEVNLLLVGEQTSQLTQEGLSYGADNVYLTDDPMFSEFNSDAYTHLISALCKKIQPFLCLFGQNDMGREIAPRVAARLVAGLCMDCAEIKVGPEKRKAIQTRPVYGGKALAKYSSFAGRMQVNTVKAKSMVPIDSQAGKKGEIIKIEMIGINEDIEPFQKRVSLISREKQETEGVKLEEAKVIVAGGGGIGSQEGFKWIRDLAGILRGAVGATRVPVDEGWVPHSLEIGQTGKIVNPDLYIAIGISGATQHITGMLNSKCIIAINKDSDANIFKVSNFGVVADYREILPGLIENLKPLVQ